MFASQRGTSNDPPTPTAFELQFGNLLELWVQCDVSSAECKFTLARNNTPCAIYRQAEGRAIGWELWCNQIVNPASDHLLPFTNRSEADVLLGGSVKLFLCCLLINFSRHDNKQ